MHFADYINVLLAKKDDLKLKNDSMKSAAEKEVSNAAKRLTVQLSKMASQLEEHEQLISSMNSIINTG